MNVYRININVDNNANIQVIKQPINFTMFNLLSLFGNIFVNDLILIRINIIIIIGIIISSTSDTTSFVTKPITTPAL